MADWPPGVHKPSPELHKPRPLQKEPPRETRAPPVKSQSCPPRPVDPAVTRRLPGRPCLKSFVLAPGCIFGCYGVSGFLSFLSICQEQQPVKVASGLAWEGHEKQSPDKKAFLASGAACLIHRLPAVCSAELVTNTSHICPITVNG